jgi:hypothetical protein
MESKPDVQPAIELTAAKAEESRKQNEIEMDEKRKEIVYEGALLILKAGWWFRSCPERPVNQRLEESPRETPAI